MSVPASILQNQPTDESGKTWKFPPTAAIHMAKDKRTSKGVREMFAELTKQVSHGAQHINVRLHGGMHAE